MVIYSYYSDVPELKAVDELKLSILWRQRWSAAGFEPVILSEHHAQKHPLYPALIEALAQKPTVNPRQYEAACFLRWLALGQAGGGFLSDLDVIPYLGQDGFLHDGVFSELTGAMMNRLQLYQSRGVCPSLACATPATVQRLAQVFIEGKLGRRDQGGREHHSDMYCLEDLVIAQADWVQLHDKVICYSDAGWEQSPLVHFANAYLAPKGLVPRYKHIPKLRPWT